MNHIQNVGDRSDGEFTNSGIGSMMDTKIRRIISKVISTENVVYFTTFWKIIAILLPFLTDNISFCHSRVIFLSDLQFQIFQC